MKNTVQVAIFTTDPRVREELIARLSVENFDGFEENDVELLAFATEDNYDAAALKTILLQYNLISRETIIEAQNWNTLWESNFNPVTVDNFCTIRANFHPPNPDIPFEIIITPKMSFGTGHHSTTYMMVSQMSRIDFKDKQVSDFGTGTGILAILAEKLGAKNILAIDYDDWSIENAKENIETNNFTKIELQKADSFYPQKKFDVILANINKSVILANVNSLSFGLVSGGLLLLSGLLKEDEHDIIEPFAEKGLKHLLTEEKNQWISLLLQYV